ncbi:Dynamin- GTPase protein [Entomophthora muscae]|uniref:Dynamin- GTPase protein n=1 Tax=Entomophthora muscae TaxID=34485 RepID=A0ACC2TPR3_9FUNG|nr:Dynamin- GTPase protein [Entomophthora muscae]
MDAGTNALDVLTGRVLNLKLGFIGVVNRSQQDTVTNKPIVESLKAEAEFFSHHPAYKSIAHRCGTSHLAKTLNQVLVNHIRERLPDMKSKLNTMIGQTQQELASYGDPKVESLETKGLLVLRLLTDFARAYTSSIDGTNPQAGRVLCGGARIYDIFNFVFGSALQAINPASNLTHQDIRIAIRNSTGPRPALFVPEIAFEILIKPQIKLLEQPSVRCAELAYEELMKICHSCSSKELTKFPKLNAKINEVVSDLLRERLKPTTDSVENLISLELAYINTRHPDFIGATGALNAIEIKHQPEQSPKITTTGQANDINSRSIVITKGSVPSSELAASKEDDVLSAFFGGEDDAHIVRNSPNPAAEEFEDTEVQLIRALISSYFQITSKTIQDLVPKAVMCHLVNFTKDHLQNRLVSSLYKPGQLDELLMEDETLADERAKCQELLNLYKKAYEIINEAT